MIRSSLQKLPLITCVFQCEDELPPGRDPFVYFFPVPPTCLTTADMEWFGRRSLYQLRV